MAATVGIDSEFPYVKIVSYCNLVFRSLFLSMHLHPSVLSHYLVFSWLILLLFCFFFSFLVGQISAESMIGLLESTKCAQIVKVCLCF